jgi:hypothetical protein
MALLVFVVLQVWGPAEHVSPHVHRTSQPLQSIAQSGGRGCAHFPPCTLPHSLTPLVHRFAFSTWLRSEHSPLPHYPTLLTADLAVSSRIALLSLFACLNALLAVSTALMAPDAPRMAGRLLRVVR